MKIFDIGANLGNFTDFCLQTIPDVELITVEANVALISSLEGRFAGKENVIILNKAISDVNDSEVDFYISNADTISTCNPDLIYKSRFTANYTWGAPVKIKTINLDKMIELYGMPDLIKLDVEGYEYAALKGLTKKANKICFEWAEEMVEQMRLTCQHLKTLGYSEIGYINGDEPMKEPESYSSFEEFGLFQELDPNRKNRWGMIWVK